VRQSDMIAHMGWSGIETEDVNVRFHF